MDEISINDDGPDLKIRLDVSQLRTNQFHILGTCLNSPTQFDYSDQIEYSVVEMPSDIISYPPVFTGEFEKIFVKEVDPI